LNVDTKNIPCTETKVMLLEGMKDGWLKAVVPRFSMIFLLFRFKKLEDE